MKTSATLLALLATLLADTAADAAEVTRISDPPRDLPGLGRAGNVDIVAASSRQVGSDLVHTVTMREPVRLRPRSAIPLLVLDPDERPDHGDSYVVYRRYLVLLKENGGTRRIGRAGLEFERRTWTFTLDPGLLPDRDRYSWYVVAEARGTGDGSPGRGPLPVQTIDPG